MKRNYSLLSASFFMLLLFPTIQATGNSFAEKYGQNAVNYAAAVQLLLEVYKEKGTPFSTIVGPSISPQFEDLKLLLFSDPLKGEVTLLPSYKEIIDLIRVTDPAKLEKQNSDPKDAKPLSASQSIVLNNQIAVSGAGNTGGAGVSLPLEARIINAAADLILDRLQQELAMTFFGKFKKDLNEDPTLKIILPKTVQFLNAIVDKPLLLPTLGATWKAAFADDLKNMPWSMVEIWRQKEGLDINITEYGDCIRVLHRAIETYTKIKSGMHPAVIIHQFAIATDDTKSKRSALNPKPSNEDLLSPLQHTVRLFDHISQNLLSSTGRGGWVSGDGLKFLENDEAMKMFLRILVEDDILKNPEKKNPEKANSVFYNRRNTSLADERIDILQFMQDNIATIRPLLYEFQLLANSVDGHIAGIQAKKAKGEKVAEEDYFSYVQTTYELIKFGHKIATIGYNVTIPAQKTRKDEIDGNFNNFIVPIGESGGKLALAAQNGKFGAALSELMVIFEKMQVKRVARNTSIANYLLPSISSPAERTKAITMVSRITSLPITDYEIQETVSEVAKTASEWSPRGTLAINVKSLFEQLPLLKNPFYTKLLRYTSFMVDIINAKTVEETKQALQSVALPAGSYTLKRKSPFSINLTAYSGLAIGGEGIKDSATGKFGQPVLYFGPSVPIGIDLTTDFTPTGILALPFEPVINFFSTGTGTKARRFSNELTSWLFSSTSLFLGIADLGNLITYRLSSEKDNVTNYPNIGLRQIFSPTIALMFGTGKNDPFTMGVAVQLAPKLREITNEKIIERERDAFRYFITLGVDLPFFNFYASEPTEETP